MSKPNFYFSPEFFNNAQKGKLKIKYIHLHFTALYVLIMLPGTMDRTIFMTTCVFLICVVLTLDNES